MNQLSINQLPETRPCFSFSANEQESVNEYLKFVEATKSFCSSVGATFASPTLKEQLLVAQQEAASANKEYDELDDDYIRLDEKLERLEAQLALSQLSARRYEESFRNLEELFPISMGKLKRRIGRRDATIIELQELIKRSKAALSHIQIENALADDDVVILNAIPPQHKKKRKRKQRTQVERENESGLTVRTRNKRATIVGQETEKAFVKHLFETGKNFL